MVVKRSVCRETISLLPCSALLSMNSEVDGDMCVADPSVEQSSCSMDSCTGESTRSNTGDYGNWETRTDGAMVTAESDASVEAAKRLPEEEEKHNTSGESDNSVMIIDVDKETTPNGSGDNTKLPSKAAPPNKEIKMMDRKDKSGEYSQLSEEMISEIDKEIYKSLTKQLNMRSLLGLNAPKSNGGRGAGRPRTPVSLLKKDVTATGTILNPKLPKPKLSLDAIKTGELIDKHKSERKDSSYSIQNKEKRSIFPKSSSEVKQQSKKEQTSVPKSTSEVKPDPSKEDTNKDEEVVWICFVCAKEFANQEELMSHQDLCDDSLTEEDAGPASVETDNVDPKPDIDIDSPLNTGQNIIKLELNSEKVVFPTSIIDTKTNVTSPVPTKLTKVGTGIKSLPLGLPSRRFIRRKPIKDIYIPPPRETYFECLGLGQTPAVEEIFRSPRKSVCEDDCPIIDLTIEDKTQHSSPITPRTRSLMSQLSRDESTRRRHLSFSSTPVKTVENKIVEEDQKMFASSDSDSSDSVEEESIKRKNIPPRSALLTIPLTSPLGQRLKKHWQNDNKVPVISNIESFCKTVDQMSVLEQEAVDKKNPMMEKLRHRPPPQITFKFTKKYLNKWFHKYKFTMADKLEFQKILKTGLERESRRRVKRMKPCKVVLQRLKKKDIKYWTTPRVRPVHQHYVQGYKPMTASHNLGIRSSYPGMRRIVRAYAPSQRMTYVPRSRFHMPALQQRLGYTSYRLSGGQVSQQYRPAQPTPQLLVRPHSGMGNGMRLEVMQLNSQYPQLQSVLTKQYTAPPTHSQRRKQTFDKVRTDDNLVICLSSDEEEESNKHKPSCLKCSKGVCSQHNKPKPAIQPKPVSKFVPITPRIPGASVNGAQTVSQMLGTNRQYVNNQMLKVSQASTASSVQPGFTSLSLLTTNSQNIRPVGSGNSGGSENTLTVNMETDTPTEGDGEENSGSGRSQSDSEYMDYEVICIDSDEDNE